jgi:sugar/nucleoside kinase (ribokinase family)
MTALGVVGNISRDTAEHPHRQHHLLGGAALYIALAAARTGVTAAPIAVIGHDLAETLRDPQLTLLDLTDIAVVDQPTCQFHLSYDQHGTLLAVDAAYGAAQQLTAHALQRRRDFAHVHVCCRRPLDLPPVLAALVDRRQPFSVDFITASAEEMIEAAAPFLRHARIVFTDINEYALLTRAVAAEELRAVTVTDGPRPAVLYRHGQPAARTPIPQTEAVEVTGAGDTFTGTFLAATLHGAPDTVALSRAAHVATTRVATIGITLHPQPP